jgi:hypothetical protein
MITGNKFRARADECLREADSMTDPERKLVHLDLARRWMRRRLTKEMPNPGAVRLWSRCRPDTRQFREADKRSHDQSNIRLSKSGESIAMLRERWSHTAPAPASESLV